MSILYGFSILSLGNKIHTSNKKLLIYLTYSHFIAEVEMMFKSEIFCVLEVQYYHNTPTSKVSISIHPCL